MAVLKKVKGAKAKEKEVKKKRRREDDEDEKFKLPTEPTEPEGDLRKYIWLIFGEKKIGKTTLTSKMGKALHMFTEPGGKALRLYPILVNDWRTFRKSVRAFIKSDFEYAVVDIADPLYGMSEDFVCDKLAIPDLSAEEWGKGWREHRKEFEREMMRLINCGKGVVFISHAQEVSVEVREGGSYDRIMPTMHKRMRELIEGRVDIWAYYAYEKKRRVLYILGDDHISAGHRLEGRFLTPDGQPIRRIDMGSSAEQGWKNVRRAFENKFEPPRDSDVDSPEQEEKKQKKMKKKKFKKF